MSFSGHDDPIVALRNRLYGHSPFELVSCSDISLFSLPFPSLKQVVTAHGLVIAEADYTSSVCSILTHILLGKCFYTSGRLQKACKVVRQHFRGPSSFLITILNWACVKVNNVDDLKLIANVLHAMRQVRYASDSAAQCKEFLQNTSVYVADNLDPIAILRRADRMNIVDIHECCHLHHIRVYNSDCLRTVNELILHLCTVDCVTNLNQACTLSTDGSTTLLRRVQFLREIKKHTFRIDVLRQILRVLGISTENDSKSTMRKSLQLYIDSFVQQNASEFKRLSSQLYRNEIKACDSESLQEIQDAWPQIVSDADKDNALSAFRDATMSSALQTYVCAVCAERKNKIFFHETLLLGTLGEFLVLKGRYPMDVLNPFKYDSQLNGLMLEPKGVAYTKNKIPYVRCCKSCYTSLFERNLLPRLAIANDLYIGPVPSELQDLTIVEECMISRRRAKVFIMHLNDGTNKSKLKAQRGLKGHIIIHPSYPKKLGRILPHSLDDIVTRICVLFVGSNRPTKEWLKTQAKPLLVRRERVRSALIWLKRYNRQFVDIEIDHEMVDKLPDEDVAPVRIEYEDESCADDINIGRYDVDESTVPEIKDPVVGSIFDSVVVTDVNGRDLTSAEMAAAALRHLKSGQNYVEMRHGAEPSNDYDDPYLYALLCPTLFPYSCGSPDGHDRKAPISLRAHFQHLFRLDDTRFQTHMSFLFIAFNILQRHVVHLSASIRVRKPYFSKFLSDFSHVSEDAIKRVSDRIKHGGVAYSDDPEELAVVKLMREVTLVNNRVDGTCAAQTNMRNEIRGMIITYGVPSFYITVNPADVLNPIVKLLMGTEIDIDNMLGNDLPSYWEQCLAVSRNPFVAANFFDMYMQTFIKHLLGYDGVNKKHTAGVLGRPKAYYGCVEAQGRGTLHCHFVLWLDGALNPQEIKERILRTKDEDFRRRLILYLDNVLYNCIPNLPNGSDAIFVQSQSVNACTVRGPRTNADQYCLKRGKDMHFLVKECQVHMHNKSCYKYHKTECRYNLDPKNTCAETSVDDVTGDLSYRVVDGMVNNYNDIMIQALRCNMDIKFIGSGRTAQAIVQYITDYITKTPLKSYAAYAAMQIAVKKVSKPTVVADDLTKKVRKLLVTCSNSLISKQELSAQQVASYLLNNNDHYTSDVFRSFLWTTFEAFISREERETFEHESEQVSSKQAYMIAGPNELSDEEDSDTSDTELDNDRDDDDNGIQVDSVAVTKSHNGSIVSRGNYLMDYIYRGDDFGPMSLWNFLSTVDKVPITAEVNRLNRTELLRKKKAIYPEHNKIPVDTPEDSCNDSDADNDISPPNLLLVNAAAYKRGRKPNNRTTLKKEHPEHKTHILKLRCDYNQFVPVPTGPRIYRRDRPDIFEKYCRLMLIFFKPWKSVSDLCEKNQLWSNSFSAFVTTLDCTTQRIINNMQQLHECRDSRDDHFAKRRMRLRGFGFNDGTRSTNVNTDYPVEEMNTEEVLLNLRHIEKLNSKKTLAETRECFSCIDTLTRASFIVDDTDKLIFESPETANQNIYCVTNCTNDMEQLWRKTYEERRELWKKLFITNNDLPGIPFHSHSPAAIPSATITNVGNAPLGHLTLFKNLDTAEISSLTALSAPEKLMHYLEIAYTLNEEQIFAFKSVATHSLKQTGCEPMEMIISGPGGTGKSTVIACLIRWFALRGESNRLRVSSFTGAAATNIGGVTIHSALNFGSCSKPTSSGRGSKELLAMWRDTDYFLIDEMSMINLEFLADISETLSIAKEDPTTYGGVSMIYAGDFKQLPPVFGKALYCSLSDKNNESVRSQTVLGHKAMAGRLLWLRASTVVVLYQQMRQCGPQNDAFRKTLLHLSVGDCTDSDYELLQSRVIDYANVDISTNDWFDCPIITRQNRVKDTLNYYCVITYAQRINKQVHLYYSEDCRNGNRVTNETELDYLMALHTGHTKYLGVLPIVIGMRVMVLHNYDVPGGVVNGCEGIVAAIRYKEDNTGKRYVTSCVVKVVSSTCDSLPGLDDKHIVVLQETTDFYYVNPVTNMKSHYYRKQLPIVPAYVMTDYKAQGRTMPRVIVDLESSQCLQSAYVMLSCAKSLNGLLILWPFKRKRITTNANHDLLAETARLDFLAASTRLFRCPDKATNADVVEYLQLATTAYESINAERTRLDETLTKTA